MRARARAKTRRWERGGGRKDRHIPRQRDSGTNRETDSVTWVVAGPDRGTQALAQGSDTDLDIAPWCGGCAALRHA